MVWALLLPPCRDQAPHGQALPFLPWPSGHDMREEGRKEARHSTRDFALWDDGTRRSSA